ncbi:MULTISPECIES: hypothetical protein [unclassified Rhizobium]|uniref:hypothetical protein n=1 Tax=unclassified Rhizobium TaxID=2613769 RepID=UPI0012E206DE|nr:MULTISPECIES: hypothetical protein [unclassified Rhizobium]
MNEKQTPPLQPAFTASQIREKPGKHETHQNPQKFEFPADFFRSPEKSVEHMDLPPEQERTIPPIVSRKAQKRA